MKVCCVFNMAPKYNEEFYLTMDKQLDCHFIIGEQSEGIEEMDKHLLSNCYEPKRIKVWGNVAYEKGVIRELRNISPDVVISTLDPYNLTSWMLKIYCLFTNTALWYISHGWYGKEKGLKKLIKKIHFSNVSAFLLYGNYAKKLMIKEGFDDRKLFVLHNSLNYSKQIEIRNQIVRSSIFGDHFGNDNPVILFIGRLTKVKKLDMLLNAVANLKQKGDNYNICFVGDGTERDRLQEISCQLNIEKQVWFYGACYDELENAEIIFNADVCVAPGNVGLTAMHCMVFGCPVITHNDFAWQMPEFESIHEGITGSFFEHGNLSSLQDTISKWFESHKSDREEVRKACYNEIDTSWTPQFEIDVLNKALSSLKQK